MGLATGGFSLAQAAMWGHIICAPLRKPFCMKQEFTRWSIARQGGVQSFDVSAWTIEASLIRATDSVTDRK
jgi:hypothetical protein